MTIIGLKELTKQLDVAARAARSLDGEIGEVTFDPANPASVEAAASEIEAMVDRKLSAYSGNPLVAHMASELKAAYCRHLRERALAWKAG